MHSVFRIGTNSTHKGALIAGINSSTVSGAAVLVNANGRLGVASSARRYKEDIRPIGKLSERLFSLQPVSFRYKNTDQQGTKPVQFGLIAEDVAQAFPELVVANEDGQPETVAYHVLPALLLNELQKAHRDLQQAQALIQKPSRQLNSLQTELILVRSEVAQIRRSTELVELRSP